MEQSNLRDLDQSFNDVNPRFIFKLADYPTQYICHQYIAPWQSSTNQLSFNKQIQIPKKQTLDKSTTINIHKYTKSKPKYVKPKHKHMPNNVTTFTQTNLRQVLILDTTIKSESLKQPNSINLRLQKNFTKSKQISDKQKLQYDCLKTSAYPSFMHSKMFHRKIEKPKQQNQMKKTIGINKILNESNRLKSMHKMDKTAERYYKKFKLYNHSIGSECIFLKTIS